MTTPKQKTFPRIFYTSLIVESIVSYLALADIAALCATCRSLREIVQLPRDTHLNINVFLKVFIKDCSLFRHQLGANGGLLTGTFVLNFLESHQRRALVLDI